MGKEALGRKIASAISKALFSIFLKLNNTTAEKYWAEIALSYMQEYECDCESVSETLMKQNMSCPVHGSMRQRLENILEERQ